MFDRSKVKKVVCFSSYEKNIFVLMSFAFVPQKYLEYKKMINKFKQYRISKGTLPENPCVYPFGAHCIHEEKILQ